MGVSFLKRLFLWIILPLLLAGLLPRADAVETRAAGAVLMDAESGRVLYEQDMHCPRPIASITKLMTALVAVEQAEDLDAPVRVKGEWLGSEGSSIYLQAGETVTLRGLLYGLLLQSGNDAAMAIACHVAGSEAAFAGAMNERAQSLGMEHTHFTNASGLSEDGHYSSAYDMALLACECLKNETVAEICATKSITVGSRTFVNHNKLLYRCEGCVGMKTGFTKRSGRTLVSAATRRGQTLVCVTLNDGDDWNDHERLYDYGFSAYPRTVLCTEAQQFGRRAVEGSLIPSVPVAALRETAYPLAEGEKPRMTIELNGGFHAPVAAGTVAGCVQWWLDGRVIAQTPLICSHAVPGNEAGRPKWEGLFHRRSTEAFGFI